MKVPLLLFAALVMLNLKSFSQLAADRSIKPSVENKGVHIEYTDNGINDTTLLFVHGWCTNKTYWNGQVDFFKSKYRIVTIDLAGYGNSGSNRSIWTVEEFALDVEALILKLDLKNIILIGHSMSGDIILEAANNIPDRIIGFVGVENFTDVGKDMSKQMGINRYFNSLTKDFIKVGGAYVQSLFYNRTDSINRTRVLKDFERATPLIAIESLKQNIKYSGGEAGKLKSLRRKIYLINSDKSPINKKGFDSNVIDYELTVITGTGHYPMIEKPEAFNSILEAILIEIKKLK